MKNDLENKIIEKANKEIKAILKGQHIRIKKFNDWGTLIAREQLLELLISALQQAFREGRREAIEEARTILKEVAPFEYTRLINRFLSDLKKEK